MQRNDILSVYSAVDVYVAVYDAVGVEAIIIKRIIINVVEVTTSQSERSMKLNRRIINKINNRIMHDSRLFKREEQTKTHLILPFLENILGYDEPTTLRAEDDTDAPSSNQYIDYACYGSDGRRRIVVECKSLDTCLDNSNRQVQAKQLQDYFSYTESDIAILTNGKEYRFYNGNDKKWIEEPILTIDVTKPLEAYEEEFLNLISYQKYDLMELTKLIDALPYLKSSSNRKPILTSNQEKRRQRRNKSPLKFSEIGLKPGDEIYYINDKSKSFVIDTDRTIKYDGHSVYLTQLARILLGLPENAPIQGSRYFTDEIDSNITLDRKR